MIAIKPVSDLRNYNEVCAEPAYNIFFDLKINL